SESDFITIETRCFIYSPPQVASNTIPSTSRTNEEDEENSSDAEGNDGEEGKYFLYLEEAFFLAYGLGRMIVKTANKPMTLPVLWNFCKKQKVNGKSFAAFYAVYHYYRSKGWVVKRGDNYGVDFVLYKCHPQQYHSTYGVYILRQSENVDAQDAESLTWRHLATLCRILKSVKKSLLVCHVKEKSDDAANDNKDEPQLENYIVDETNVSQWFTGKHNIGDT
uniref:tRNA-intron lyase n=1 Tax=Romanomermis culicivorax TaxID=13658 RepID=A0A915IN73_ROMCU